MGGWLVADLSKTVPNSRLPAKPHLRNRPKESDGTRALFSFLLNSCGTSQGRKFCWLIKLCLALSNLLLLSSISQGNADMKIILPAKWTSVWAMSFRLSLWGIYQISLTVAISLSTVFLEAPLSDMVVFQCSYHLRSQLLFKSNTAGISRIVHTKGRTIHYIMNTIHFFFSLRCRPRSCHHYSPKYACDQKTS